MAATGGMMYYPMPYIMLFAIDVYKRQARNSPITHGIFLSQDGMYGNFRFTNSRMGEQRESGDCRSG